MNELALCFVKNIGTDIDGNNLYEFLFTHDLDSFWGEGFEYMPASLASELTPNEDSYEVVKTITTDLKLGLACESCCHSMQDCIDDIVALAYEDITGYEEFPDDGRLVLHFGDSYEKVELELIKRNIKLQDKLIEQSKEENPA